MSAHEKPQHPYHLVNPSPWPLFMSISALVMVTGGLFSMHGKMGGALILVIGLLMVLTGCYGWWRDVVREGAIDKAHTSPVRTGLRMGMAMFIASEVMFFFVFFWAFFNASLFPVLPLEDIWPAIGEATWPPEGIKTFDPWDLPFINTLILLLSGTTVTWAHHALMHNDQKGLINGLALTVALGAIFTCFQAFEYSHAAFGFTDGIYASTFYLATGFHGFHVLIGTIFLGVCLVRAMRGQFNKEHHLGFEFAAWYWHFVDVVWLFLFTFIYVWGE